MYGKHMTEMENEKRKQQILRNLRNGKRVEEIYPQVEKIEIHYEKMHLSFLDPDSQKGVWTIMPHDEVFFVLGCLNTRCTSIGFDLQNVISSAIHAHQTEVSREVKCDGQEAPDHPKQRCGGSLKYTIKICYK